MVAVVTARFKIERWCRCGDADVSCAGFGIRSGQRSQGCLACQEFCEGGSHVVVENALEEEDEYSLKKRCQDLKTAQLARRYAAPARRC